MSDFLDRSQEIGEKFLAWAIETGPCPISINDRYWFKKLCALFEKQAELEAQLRVACHVNANDRVGFDWDILGKIADLEMENARLNCEIAGLKITAGGIDFYVAKNLALKARIARLESILNALAAYWMALNGTNTRKELNMAEKVDFSELISNVASEASNLTSCYEWGDGASIAEADLAEAKKTLAKAIEKLQKERDDLLEIASVLSWCNHGSGCPQGRVISESEPAFRLIPCTCGFDEAVKKLKGIQGRE